MPRPFALPRALSRVVVALVACALPAWGEGLPVAKGEVYLGSPKAAALPALLTTEEEMPAVPLRLAEPSAAEWRAAAAEASRSRRAPIGFGRAVSEVVEAGSARAFAWHRVGPWHIAKLRVQSPGAGAIRVGLRIAATREPWELRVAGSRDETLAHGPVRQAGPFGAAALHWTPVTEGDAQVVEIASPAGEPVPLVEVVLVSHLASGPSGRFDKRLADIGRASPCELDFACVASPSAALANAGRATVKLVLTALSGTTYLCTGTMLNDTDGATQVPYLYAANHCFDAAAAPFHTPAQMQAVAGTLNTFFFFDAAACGSPSPGPAWAQRSGGATYLYGNPAQDVLLLRLNDTPPAGTWLAGWDPNAVAEGTPVTVLHHPWGDLKKFTTGIAGAASVVPAPQDAPTGYWTATYDQGTTEPGSSGAALFSFTGSEYLLRGGLFGGLSSCASPTAADWYSRFDVAYPSLRAWLQPATGPAFNVTDLWYFGPESGWGLNLTQHASGQVFGVWYTYAANARPYWLVMPGGRWVNGTTFTGDLYTVSGPHFAQAFDPAAVVRRNVGTLTLTFANASTGAFTWTVNGVTGTKTITRQPF